MEKKHTLILDKEFTQFCELNNISDIEKQAQETFNRGFSLLKYGEIPNGNKIREIIEVPKETIKEVIVEKIVERIVEVPVEVIREVIKEITICINVCHELSIFALLNHKIQKSSCQSPTKFAPLTN